MSLLRPTAHKYGRTLFCLAVICLGMLGVSSASAMAAPKGPKAAPAPTKVITELAVCPGQTFSQPFESFKDSNFYTLVEGSEFNEGPEGWELFNGAEVVGGSRPDGSSGGVLDLPSGAYAVSPAVCVTLQYPTARTWVRGIQGGGGVTVGVFYPGTGVAAAVGQPVGKLGATSDGEWTLSNPFQVKPELTGKTEGVREVRFVYANQTGASEFQLSGLYVDPRMR
jgi:hypothetical protein